MRNSIRLFVAAAGFAILLICFQNCGQFKKASFVSNSSLSSHNPWLDDNGNSLNEGENVSGPAPEIIDWQSYIPAGQVSDDCKSDIRYNVCLVLKDPITSNNMKFFTPRFTTLNATAEQERKVFKMGLKIPLSNFENAHFKLAIKGSSLSLPTTNNQGNFKYAYRNDQNHNIGQINSFYWLNRQRQYMLDRTQKFYLSNKSVSIYAFDGIASNNAYYDMVTHSLSIGGRYSDAGVGDLALDVGVIAHEAGHGNLAVASNGAMLIGGSTYSKEQNSFCETKNGCFGAIHEGQGDVHSFMLFPNQSPAVGLYYTNSAEGIRNPASIKTSSLTARSVFNLSNGEIHDMGEVYTSVWYEVWLKAKKSGNEKDIEILFSEHLASLSTNDTFSSAYSSIAGLAQQLFPEEANKLIADFRTEFVRLDIDIP